jgi:protease-4
MAKKSDIVIGVLIGLSVLFVLLFFVIGFFGVSGGGADVPGSGARVGIYELRGLILDSQPVIRKLEKLARSRSIKAIVLRIESPGGGVAASQEIYEAVKKIRERGKPVVVSMGSVAASGGYYVACAADSIIANPGTTTGSIGVILEVPNIQKLLDKVGVRFQIIKSGKFKDIGSPYRDMRPEERRYLQEFVDDAFQQFVSVVSEARKLTREKVLAIADGRILTGKQALEAGLVDRLGDLQDAVDMAWRMAGMKGKPRVYRFPKRKITVFDLLFGDVSEVLRIFFRVPAVRYQMLLNGLE